MPGSLQQPHDAREDLVITILGGNEG